MRLLVPREPCDGRISELSISASSAHDYMYDLYCGKLGQLSIHEDGCGTFVESMFRHSRWCYMNGQPWGGQRIERHRQFHDSWTTSDLVDFVNGDRLFHETFSCSLFVATRGSTQMCASRCEINQLPFPLKTRLNDLVPNQGLSHRTSANFRTPSDSVGILSSCSRRRFGHMRHQVSMNLIEKLSLMLLIG
jgi:hypothetical protein